MPIYEYKCNSCGHNFEIFKNKDDEPFCPACNSRGLARKFSIFANISKNSKIGCETNCGVSNDICRQAGGCGCAGNFDE